VADAFDSSKFKDSSAKMKAWDELCAETPSKEDTCKRIRRNQELYLEYQQKCLHKYDPKMQMAMEHAGDVIRELSKCCSTGYCGWGYVQEKVNSLQKSVDVLQGRLT